MLLMIICYGTIYCAIGFFITSTICELFDFDYDEMIILILLWPVAIIISIPPILILGCGQIGIKLGKWLRKKGE